MAWCKAFDPIDESPPWRPDPHASSRRAHVRTRAARGRSAFFARTISTRAQTNPGQRPQIAFLHERIRFLHVRTRAPARTGRNARTNSPATRPNPSHPSRTCRTVRTNSGNARPNPSRPLPPPLSATPDHSAKPPPRRRTSVLPARTPEPEPPSARHFPPCRHPSDHLPPQPHPRHPTARPPSLRSGFRPGAAPVPPSASLPEDRYHPVNAALRPRLPRPRRHNSVK